MLCRSNPNAGTFVRDNFKGLFFGRGVHSLIDQFRANCNLLIGYKKDIALFALGKTCISSTCGFGHFASTTSSIRPFCHPNEFKERFKSNLYNINSLVFDNGRSNKAINMDVIDAIPKVKTDMIFFDPPYATEFSATNYEKLYHFVEGLMVYWNGLKINYETKSNSYEIEHESLNKNNVYDFFNDLFERAEHYPFWIFSYRDHAYPTEKEIKDIISSYGRKYNVAKKFYQYTISGKRTPASFSKEYLFVCKKAQSLFNIPSYFSKNMVIPRPDRFLKRIR